MYKIDTVSAGTLKLDGGAMFGVVPKRMWEKLVPPDDQNLCTWIMRCLVIRNENRTILVDCGIGDKQDERFRSHFYPTQTDNLLSDLKLLNIERQDVTDVFLTHLHFDHCGGALMKDDTGTIVPTFPNATYWSNQKHWDWAMQPNPREKASFLKENFQPLLEQGKVKMLPTNDNGVLWIDGIEVYFFNGHTEAMMCPLITTDFGKVFYCADLVPSMYHLGLPYVMAYDIRPLETMKEKAWLQEKAITENWTLIFEHDLKNKSCRIVKDEKGGMKPVAINL